MTMIDPLEMLKDAYVAAFIPTRCVCKECEIVGYAKHAAPIGWLTHDLCSRECHYDFQKRGR